MNVVVVDAHAVLRTLDGRNLLETAIQANALTHDIGSGVGILALSVGGGFPREQIMVLVGLADGKAVDRQRLHHIGAVIALGDELQHTFIYSTAHVKAEHRVKAVFHVGKVLVREQLHEHSRYLGHTGLVVTLVPHAAARPVGLPLGADVLDNLGREQVAVAARQFTGRAVGILAELLATAVGAIDEQGTHDFVIGGAAGIGVQAEGDVHRHLQAATVGQHVAAAGQVVHPLAAAAIVVGIVVDAVRGGINRIGEASPLQVVTRSQVEPGVVAAADVAVFHAFLAQIFLVFLFGGDAAVLLGGQCHTAHDVALAATHLDGIGGDDRILFIAQVRDLDYRLVHALGQRESPQIDPHAACHRLVDTELAGTALAVDGIGHVARTIGQ